MPLPLKEGLPAAFDTLLLYEACVMSLADAS
jgi:hypothetical protein